jgi:hypothetical protein
MALTPEELAMFGEAPAEPPPPPAPAKTSKMTIQERCPCGVILTPDNSSRWPGGGYQHHNCPQGPANAVLPPDAPKSDPALAAEQPKPEPEPKKRGPGRPPKAKPEPGEAPTPGMTIGAPFVPSPAAQTIRIELGPETLAALAKLLRPDPS